MARARDFILDWAAQGRIPPHGVRRALEYSGALPGAADWRAFLDRLLLWLGVAMLASGVVFFLAYNWQELGRFAKFALVEGLIVASLAVVWWQGLEHAGGKAALLGAALVVGALLAFIGQTYQTGADTFELFAVWAGAILPWALVGRFPALWVLWLALVNLSVTLYFRAFGGVLGIVFGPERQLWLLFALNTAATALWEALAAAGVAWLRERWAVRVLATASGACVTALAVLQIVDWEPGSDWAAPAWMAWLALAYFAYRNAIKDVYVLAGGALSVIVVAATFLGKHMLKAQADAGAFLLIGVVVIGLSAAAGYWLKRVASEMERT
ncbi:MAG: DUF2157 domain-containing protein [Betaproteobacteria bacterium]|nr:MAG: DUF2157 domain-containing protein [Betaproteobacteria bacterium]